MEKVPSNNNNENLNLNKKEYVNFDNSEIEDFLKINTLNEVLDDNMKNKKICPHVVKLVDNFFKNLNMKIIENLNNFDIGTNNLNEIKNFKGNQVEKYFKLKNINDNLIEEYKKNIENLLNEEKEKPKFNNEIEKINKEYEQKKEEINKKIDNITKENENLKNNKSSKLDFKYSQKDIDEIKKNTLEEKNKLEDSYKNKINSLNNEIKNLKDKINELTKKENELDEKEININVPKIDINKVTIEKIDLDDFIKKNDSNYINRLVESNEKLDNEISELTTKANKLSGEVSNLKLENSELKRKLDLNQSKNFDEDSYEQVLLKQFEIMKEAFIKKIDNLSIQLSNAKSDSRKKINQIEQNLKESEHLKNIFLQQIISLKKQLGNKI
jgi:DNA repair exonuclease SbcCD ATPase subunit